MKPRGRTFCRAVTMVVLQGSTSSAGAEPGLVLRWCDPHGLFGHGFGRVGQELDAIFDDAAVELVWKKCTRGVDPQSPEGRFHEIQVLLVHSEPLEWGLSTMAMGAVLSRSGRQSEVPSPRLAHYSLD